VVLEVTETDRRGKSTLCAPERLAKDRGTARVAERSQRCSRGEPNRFGRVAE
jgi:hypothetical protein